MLGETYLDVRDRCSMIFVVFNLTPKQDIVLVQNTDTFRCVLDQTGSLNLFILLIVSVKREVPL